MTMALLATLTTWKWQMMAGLMRSVGCWSKGIALGYERGFDWARCWTMCMRTSRAAATAWAR